MRFLIFFPLFNITSLIYASYSLQSSSHYINIDVKTTNKKESRGNLHLYLLFDIKSQLFQDKMENVHFRFIPFYKSKPLIS